MDPVPLNIKTKKMYNQPFVIDIPIERGINNEGPGGEDHVVKCDIEGVEDRLATHQVRKSVEKLRHGEQHVLVEEVENHVALPYVVHAPMDKKQLPKALELPNGEVTGHYRTHAFVAINAYTDIGLLDHITIVGAIADSQCDFLFPGSDQLDHFGFLFRRGSTANHTISLYNKPEELVSGIRLAFH